MRIAHSTARFGAMLGEVQNSLQFGVSPNLRHAADSADSADRGHGPQDGVREPCTCVLDYGRRQGKLRQMKDGTPQKKNDHYSRILKQ